MNLRLLRHIEVPIRENCETWVLCPYYLLKDGEWYKNAYKGDTIFEDIGIILKSYKFGEGENHLVWRKVL